MLDKVKSLLNNKGINIENKSVNLVLEEVAQKWNEFNDKEKLELAATVAGEN